MTAKEFDSASWYKGIKLKYWGKEREVVTVNFVTRVIGYKGDFGFYTAKHAKCEIIQKE